MQFQWRQIFSIEFLLVSTNFPGNGINRSSMSTSTRYIGKRTTPNETNNAPDRPSNAINTRIKVNWTLFEILGHTKLSLVLYSIFDWEYIG